jgi:hypothetical protein
MQYSPQRINVEAMEEKYPFYHPLYVPPKRTMKEVKSDFNKHLQKHSLSKTKRK